MHMSDALVSPAVGGTMWAISAGTIAYCSSKLGKGSDDSKAALMGVLGAFLFAAQMINFSIPLTGSSGHLGGGLLLSILLGPYAAFLVIASVLVVQALIFTDGGLLALGCNIFNLGFLPAFISYPLIYKKMTAAACGSSQLKTSAVVSAVIALQLGAFAVVLETVASGVSELPFLTFLSLMQPIHLAIGLVEGVVTAAVISFVHNNRPEILMDTVKSSTSCGYPVRNLAVGFLIAAVITGGVISQFASSQPDGLEWSISRVTGSDEFKGPEHGLHAKLAALQEKIALLPDYSFRKPLEPSVNSVQTGATAAAEGGKQLGTSVSGIIGGALTLMLSFMIGFILRKRALPANQE